MASVIIDFDGTIADSLPVIINLFYKWSRREKFTKEEIESLRNMSAKEVIKAVGVPLWRAPSLLAKGRRDFTKYIGQVKVFTGMPEAITALHTQGNKLYLMSSNSSENIHKYLKIHKIDQYFEHVYGNAGLFNKSKAMKRLIKRYKINRQHCYSIGDETRDVEAAKKARITSIAVDWGFNGSEILKKQNPDHLISKPSDLLNIIK